MPSIDRRTFSKTVALGGAASLFNLPLWARRTNQNKKLGYALVGLGNYATNQLAPALQETENCYLAGIVTGTPSKAELWSEKYNIPDRNIYNYDNFDTIADNPDIDIIYVVLPNSMHAEFTIRAARAGKHVITEKPMSTSVEDAHAMIDACKKNGVKLGVGYRLHYEPYNLEVRRICREKEFGEIKNINAEFGFTAGNPDQWRLNKKLAGGGALMDVGIYCIQATRYCTGMEPLSVTAQEFKTDPVKFSEVDETLYWQLEFPGGISANCSTSYAVNIHRLRVNFNRGFAELGPAFDYGPLKGHTSKGELNYANVTEQALHMDDFARSVANDSAIRVPGEEGLREMIIIEGIYRSIEQNGSRVQLDIDT